MAENKTCHVPSHCIDYSSIVKFKTWLCKREDLMSGIVDILYVRFRVADLAKQRQFLSDFGFAVEEVDGVLLARGTDPNRYVYVAEEGEPGFAGLGFEAQSQQDLERIAALDGAEIEALSLPGGGIGARLSDPDGNTVDVIFGIEKAEPLTPPARQPLNFGDERKRLGERVSFDGQPTGVKRLGKNVSGC
jgi:hypothetical protein